MIRMFSFLVIAISFGMISPHCAFASDWPTKPIRIIVPFAAGGAADMLGRVFAEALSTALGQQFYVENRSGGASVIGTETVAQSAPDGYTLMVSGMPTHVLGPAINKSAGYDPIRDFTHIAYLGGPPNIIVVHPSLGVHNYQQFAQKAQNEELHYVSPGLGSVGNVFAELLAVKEKLKFQHVTYKGGGVAILDLIAGHVKAGSMTFSTTRPHIQAGKLVPLAVSSPERLSDFPEIPTFNELGHPDLVATSWFSISGPARLPRSVVEKLNVAINKSMSLNSVRKHLEQEGVLTNSMSPEEFTLFVESEIKKWVPIVKASIAK